MAEIDTEALLQSIDERIAAHVAPLAEGFNALSALTQQDRTVLNELFDTSLPSDEREAARERINARLTSDEQQAQAKAEAKAIREENARLKAAVAKGPSTDGQQQVLEVFANHVRDPLVEFCDEQDAGLDFNNDIVKHPAYPTHLMPSDGDPDGWKGFRKTVKGIIRKVADEKQAAIADAGRTIIETTQTSGSGRGTPLSNYREALRTGKPLPSPEEIDRIFASIR